MEKFGNKPRSGGFNRGFRSFDDRPREMHKIKCSECGKEDQVPFKPTEGKLIYCKECYAKKNPRFGERYQRKPQETEKTEEPEITDDELEVESEITKESSEEIPEEADEEVA
jgi:CxxC-x17-CxxC domain-containing protein